MLTADVQELVSYLIGSFAVGFVVGLLTVTFKKALDLI